MTIKKKIVIFVAILFCLAPILIKAQEPVLFDQEAVGDSVAIEESVVQPELIIEDELPWWVYLWVALLIAGVASMALKSIKEQASKFREHSKSGPPDDESPKE